MSSLELYWIVVIMTLKNDQNDYDFNFLELQLKHVNMSYASAV